jgi:hypothetical protein
MSKSGRAFYDQQVKNEEIYISSPQGMMDQLEEKFTNIFNIKKAKLQQLSKRLEKHKKSRVSWEGETHIISEGATWTKK